MSLASRRGRVRAVLGPTNTGKTYLAIDRMLGHDTGMIGFPLRLLARENYDRIVSLKGRGSVALITGEEKIIPANPRWFVCTVESMPMDLPVAFLAVDEIQLCADPERGHIFTQRLLHARGLSETMFLGADTIRPLIRRLVPEAEIESRKRFSTLRYTGAKKITRLPRRSAVVAFSVDEVYAIAELIRRQRGGTAVVLGALSPRTRNAQVALYQERAVDFMVATDAIGMGLNMDVDHVAFAGLRKFDGRRPRPLSQTEIAQIAGRAGRHMNNGTFGVTDAVKPLDEETVEAVETHSFEPLKQLYWRNARLDFNSPKRLLQSLERTPPADVLIPARKADDHDALAQLAGDAEIAAIATNPAAVRQLWEVCQIPDFRKMLADHHLRLLRRVYLSLNRHDGRLPEDWVASQIDQLDATEGGIDTLTTRIAHIRTWTYITHRADWLADSAHWQGRAREIEDRLSDALHDKLTQRFVDRRAAKFDRKRGDGGELLSAVTAKGILVVEGEEVGRLDGLKFHPSEDALGDRAVMAAARRALRQDMGGRVQKLIAAEDNAFRLTDDGRILWKRAPLAHLKPGAALMRPRVALDRNELLDGRMRERIEKRLAQWLGTYIDRHFAPLPGLLAGRGEGHGNDKGKGAGKGAVSGVFYQLAEGLGSAPRAAMGPVLDGLSGADRNFLKQSGVEIGARALYFPSLLRLRQIRLRALLWSVAAGRDCPAVPFARERAVYPADAAPDEFWAATGHGRCGTVAVRHDHLARLVGALARKGRQGAFVATPDLLQLADGDAQALAAIAESLGYRTEEDALGLTLTAKPGAGRNKRKQGKPRKRQNPGKTNVAARHAHDKTDKAIKAEKTDEAGKPARNTAKRSAKGKRRRRKAPDPHSPFAALQVLVAGK
jgi:ATP-dependent RNA helicase SUPV3L1/SUV3